MFSGGLSNLFRQVVGRPSFETGIQQDLEQERLILALWIAIKCPARIGNKAVYESGSLHQKQALPTT